MCPRKPHITPSYLCAPGRQSLREPQAHLSELHDEALRALIAAIQEYFPNSHDGSMERALVERIQHALVAEASVLRGSYATLTSLSATHPMRAVPLVTSLSSIVWMSDSFTGSSVRRDD